MVDENWKPSVAAYLARLEQAVTALAHALDAFEMRTLEGAFEALPQAAEATGAASAQLESLLDERSDLLQLAASGGHRPRSLRAVLKQLGEVDLLSDCERIASLIEEQRVRTISTFVTHFHLAETSSTLIRILTRSAAGPGTYGTKVRSAGGGLLDEAA